MINSYLCTVRCFTTTIGLFILKCCTEDSFQDCCCQARVRFIHFCTITIIVYKNESVVADLWVNPVVAIKYDNGATNKPYLYIRIEWMFSYRMHIAKRSSRMSGIVIYIGKSLNIYKRVNQHLKSNTQKSNKIKSGFDHIRYLETRSEMIALLIESQEIKKKQTNF